MVLVDIGEIGVVVDGRRIKLRPSLHAMSCLGTPEEIVQIFASVMSDEPHRLQFETALSVIYACADEDIGDIFGYHEDGKYVGGIAPARHVLPLARCLVKHGITGALPPLPKKEGDAPPEYVQGFDARAMAALAMAHLGSSSKEAWSMTMTELVGALRAKFPPVEDVKQTSAHRAPTLKEHEATMAWFDKIEAKRKKRLGAH